MIAAFFLCALIFKSTTSHPGVEGAHDNLFIIITGWATRVTVRGAASAVTQLQQCCHVYTYIVGF